MEQTSTLSTDQSQADSTSFQILALDGGGIKGLFSAAVLAKLEDKCTTEIAKHFDLITGTWTGSLIAICLGLGMRPREIVQFYTNKGPSIFRSWFGLRSLRQWVWCKFPQKPLMNALRDPGAFGDKLLGQSSKRLVIPAYNLGADKGPRFQNAPS
ncbi:MAG: patatin-like phospholipase family protein [bacterium]